METDAISDLIDRVLERTSGHREHHDQEDHRGHHAVDLQVDATNVLQVRKALADEAARIDAVLDQVKGGLRLRPMGTDPASQAAATIVTGRLLKNPDSYFNRCSQYKNNLSDAADALIEIARRYGYTDDEIRASLAAQEHQIGDSGA